MKKKLSSLLNFVIVIVEIGLVPFAFVVFFNPVTMFYSLFCIFWFIPILTCIFRVIDHSTKSSFFAVTSMFYGYIMIPVMLIIIVRVLGNHYQNMEMTVFFFVSLIFIIPVTFSETKFFLDNYNIRYPLEHYEKIDKNDDEKELKVHNIIKKYLFSTAFFRLLLLLIISFTDYIGIKIPFIKDIYAGIIMSIAYDSFFKPLVEKIKERRIALIKQEILDENQIRDKRSNENISKCFQEASTDRYIRLIGKPYANKFIDLLSVYEGGLTLSEIKRIHYGCYIYLKNSCSDFFVENPYMPEDEINTTYLFLWSENKNLKDVPVPR